MIVIEMGKMKTGLYAFGVIILVSLVIGHIWGGSESFATEPLTNESVNSFISTQTLDEGDNKSATVDNGHVNVNYAKKDGTYLSEKYLIVFLAGDTTDLMPQLFANPGVNEVTITRYVKLTNDYGQSVLEPAVSITFSRATSNRLDWEAMKDQQPQNLYKVADSYYINPAIYPGVPYPMAQSQGNDTI